MQLTSLLKTVSGFIMILSGKYIVVRITRYILYDTIQEQFDTELLANQKVSRILQYDLWYIFKLEVNTIRVKITH